jgi:hypothetical protein
MLWVEDAKTLSISRSTADRHQAQARAFRLDVRLDDRSLSTPTDECACSQGQRGTLRDRRGRERACALALARVRSDPGRRYFAAPDLPAFAV